MVSPQKSPDPGTEVSREDKELSSKPTGCGCSRSHQIPEEPPAGATWTRRCILLVCCLLCLWSIHGTVVGQTYEGSKVKAAFLLKFPDFVEWPERAAPESTGPIRLGIIGENPFQDFLPEGFHPRGPATQGVQVTSPYPDDQAVSGFDLLYFSDPLSKAAANLLNRLRERPILTIGEGEPFLTIGGIIAFETEDRRLRFLVSLKNARRAGLKISSKLLNLAKRVFP